MVSKIKPIKINNKTIGKTGTTYIVAEISGNHGGKIVNLKKLIYLAKEAGCDAVKIQAYEARTITLNSTKKDFLIKANNSWNKYKNLYSLYKKAQTPFCWYKDIFQYCNKINITVFASVFDQSSVDYLEELGCPAYKIASPEITDIPLIRHVAKTKKPIILSNGLANFSDLKLALRTIKNEKNNKIIVLKCTSAYPAPLTELNLLTMKEIKRKFRCQVGFSDHTLGINIPVHAASLGAAMIEKHICLSKNSKAIDGFFSSTPKEFREMIARINQNHVSSGKISFKISHSSKKNLAGRRSLYVTRTIDKGEKITKDNIKSIRPHFGLHPKNLDKVLGKKTKVKIQQGEPFKLKYI